MRIVLACRAYPDQRAGGMLHVIEDRANALADLGHDVHVLTTGNITGPQESTATIKYGLTVHHLDCPPMSYSAGFSEQLDRRIRELCPDIAHFDSFDRQRPPWIGRERLAGSVAVTMHGMEVGAMMTDWNLFRQGMLRNAPRASYWDRMAKEAAALQSGLLDRAIAISRHEEMHLRDIYGVDGRKVRLVYNPIHESYFSNPTTERNSMSHWLCAAISGHATRGFQVAKEACRIAGVQLKVVSDVPRSEMWKQYDECAGVLLPTSYWQGWDLCVMEAVARRRPVIVSATGSYLSEAEGVAGCIVADRLDAESFAEEIISAFDTNIPESVAVAFAAYWIGYAKRWLNEVC